MNLKEMTKYVENYLYSSPVDVYDDETDEVEISSFEFINPRICQLDESNTTYIGSGNMFLATIMLTCKYYKLKKISELNQEKIDFVISNLWPVILKTLIDSNIIKRIDEEELEKTNKPKYLQVVVDNTK